MGKSVNTNKKHKCLGKCGKTLTLNSNNFFRTNNPEYDYLDGFTPYCKGCLREMIFDDVTKLVDINKFREVLKMLDKPFVRKVFDDLMMKGNFTLGDYTKQLNFSVGKGKQKTYADSDEFDEDEFQEKLNKIEAKDNIDEIQENVIVISNDDKKNEQDVIRILGYDPFITDGIEDRRLMFNSLIDFLDEETQADNFKCLTVIEIVKLFNQAERLNLTINKIMKDYKSITDNSGLIKSLTDTKKNLLASALALAKDNGISVNHNNSKSKGGNTLNGIIKKLDEIGLEAAQVNLFNLETCKAMEQIADVSNRSILNQLVLDENDYTAMIAQQKDMITKMDKKVVNLEVENRLLKIKLNDYENIQSE
jgi:hypothetical protein